MISPLRLSFEVGCPVEHAFSTWTQQSSLWWPVAHTATQEPGLRVIFEPRVGGRIFERTASGEEVDWGEIKVWEPPTRLVYTWHIATNRASATEVEMVFKGRGESTLIEIEHRGWERLGDRGPTWRRVNKGGWDGVVPDYIAVCRRWARERVSENARTPGRQR